MCSSFNIFHSLNGNWVEFLLILCVCVCVCVCVEKMVKLLEILLQKTYKLCGRD